MKFKILHLFGLITCIAGILALARMGEFGCSIIPALTFPQLFMLPAVMRWESCPEILKIRNHLVFAGLFFLILALPSMLFEFGWWRMPFNVSITLYIAPGLFILLQFIKYQAREKPNIELRIAQIIAIWFPLTMLALARLFGNRILIA